MNSGTKWQEEPTKLHAGKGRSPGKTIPRITIRRAYDPAGTDEGVRVLVDRLWPRGITKEQLGAELWLREAAPSDGLRRWFGHDPGRWLEFRTRYLAELAAKPEVILQLRQLAGEKGLTLLYGARDSQRNQAVVLQEYLLSLAD